MAVSPEPTPKAPHVALAGDGIRLLAVIAGLAVYVIALGGLRLAVQAHDAGVPVRVAVESASGATLLLGGAPIAALAGAYLGLGFLAVQVAQWWTTRRASPSSPHPRGRLPGGTSTIPWMRPGPRSRRSARVAGAVLSVVIASIASVLVVAVVAQALGLQPSVPAVSGGLLLVVLVGLWHARPFSRPLRNRPVVLSCAGGLALFGFLLEPLPHALVFLAMGATAVCGALAGGSSRGPTTSEVRLVFGGTVLVGFAAAFAIASSQPLELPRVTIDGSGASGGLLAWQGTNALVASCRAEPSGADQRHSAEGFSDAVHIRPVSARAVTVSDGAYRFNGRHRLTLLELATGVDSLTGTAAPIAGLCR